MIIIVELRSSTNDPLVNHRPNCRNPGWDTLNGVGVAAVPEEGNGLAGMRARAEALGGSLLAGPAAGGGFRVSARLPHRAGAAGPVHPTDAAAEEAM